MSGEDRARWQRVTELFARALEQPAADRTAFIQRECGGDAQLLSDVMSLLGAHNRASSSEFLERPAAALVPELLEEDPSEFVGRRVGPYVIRRELGRGGMGIVFKAEDTRLGRLVALKSVPRELAQNERSRERLRREARLAASLSHPAIATVYALEEAEAGELFIASEFVSGRSLREEVAGGPLAREILLSTACAIAGALAEAHARGIVHRDLKPENVIRRDDGQIKVLDFGLAQTISGSGPTVARLTVTGAVVGTPGYMAPEQLRGEPVDARADVFAFGVLLSELATGRHPFGGGDPGSLIAALLEGRTPLPATPIVSPEIDAIVRRCLRTRPDERFATGGEVLAALTAAGESALRGPAAEDPAIWWWEFHQVAVSVFHSAMLVALWASRGFFPAPWGSVLFYVALAVETIAVTMRLHLRFSSRHNRRIFDAQRARFARSIAGLDLFYGGLLLAFALRSANLDLGAAPLLVTAALVSLLSLLVIEPATTRAAFRA
jgi:serine/threonine-protein kinase